jgi:HlyD family secretion protein
VAPSAGVVISLTAHAGELVAAQPLLQIANLGSLVCLAEVDVADVPLVREKSEAIITCRAFRGQKLGGTVERIRNVAGAATLRPVDPRQPVDRTVTTVVIKVDAPEALRLLGGSAKEPGAAIVGLQVDVEIPL